MSTRAEQADLTRDAFLGGRLAILQPRQGYRAATDPVLLAAAVPARPGQSVLELGCGVGVALFCLAARVPGLRLTGLELQPRYAALARRNAAANGIEAQIIEGDVGAPPAVLRGQGFDHVLANPPWYSRGAGTPATDTGRETAVREAEVPLATWLDCATRRLRPGGRLTVIQQTARLPGLLAALDGRMGSIVLQPLAARPGRDAARIILQARKGGRAALRLRAPLVLHAGLVHGRDGEGFAPQAEAILRGGAALDL